jgi:hypothetical protein
LQWPFAKAAIVRLLAHLSASADPADRATADAIEEALVRAEKVELMKEINRDLRDRLTDLEAACDLGNATGATLGIPLTRPARPKDRAARFSAGMGTRLKKARGPRP